MLNLNASMLNLNPSSKSFNNSIFLIYILLNYIIIKQKLAKSCINHILNTSINHISNTSMFS
jgi:hypothetical protein